MKSNASFALWPITPFGGEDDKTKTDPGSGDGEGASGGNANSGGTQGNSGKGGQQTQNGGKADPPPDDDDDSDDDDDEYKGYTAKEMRRIARDEKKKAKDAAAEAKTLKDKEAAAERAKLDENDALKKDVSDRDETIVTLRATMTKQAIIGAIRDDTRYEWHDPEMVAQQLDPEVVKVDEQGRVEGIKASLPKVAKQHPFLLKKDNTTDDGKNGTKNGATQQNNGSGPTGFQPGQGGTSGGGGQETDRKALAENYPALASRI
jgi:hypothetical protein